MTTIYVSPTGSDRNSGSNDSPLATPRAAHDAASPGDEIVIEDGLYQFDSKLWITKSGEPGNPITMRSADGATPTFEWTGTNGGDRDSGMKFSGASHWVVRGLELRGSTYKGIVANSDSSDLVWENLEVHDNMDRGVVVNGTPNVTIRNVESHHNHDERGNGEGADGFTFTEQTSTGLVVEDCVAYQNSDDGFDLWSAAPGAVIRNCKAIDNGYDSDGDGNGFKLGGGGGGGGHTVERCVAYGNRQRGFHWNLSDNANRVVNCTAVANSVNFAFRDDAHTLRNNIAYDGDNSITSVVDDSHNSWNLDISDPKFRSTDPASSDFLRLSSSSPCINAGTDVSLSYSNDSPDLGAFEYDGNSTEERLTVDGSTTLHAADARINPGSEFGSEHSGFEGSGYVNFEPNTGAYARWDLDVAAADTYGIEIRYANGGSGTRTANLLIGDTQRQVEFPQTGGWTSWDTVEGTIDLPEGAVDLAIETTGQDAGNVDRIELWPVTEEEDRIAVDGSTTLSAADAEINSRSEFGSEHSGFEGSGYVNFEPNTGAYARWDLDVAAADTYGVEIRYANGGSSARTANLLVGETERDVRFPQTGEWTSWDTVEGTIDLPEGAVDLAIETTGEDAGNVDRIALWPVDEDQSGDETGEDRSEPTGDTPNHGYNVPEQGRTDWHVPLNENFEAIDRGVPIVDADGAKDDYTAAERALYVAIDTGTLYVGDGSEWNELGTLS